MKKQLYRAAAATVLGLSLTTGVAAADTGNVHHMYNRHQHQPTSTTFSLASSTVTNKNTVNASNTNSQVAQSGKSVVTHNWTGGSATSGNATNNNSTTANVAIDTTSSTSTPLVVTPTVDPSSDSGSYGRSTNDTSIDTSKVTNTNDVTVTNSNNQYASTGDAIVANNKVGGSATSGNATNNNSSSFTVSVSD
jgi:hypothetical protein